MISKKLKQMQLIFNSMPSLVWMKDREGNYLLINKRFNKFGIKKGIQIIGKTDFDIFPEKMALQFREVEEMVIRTKQPVVADQFYEGDKGSVWYDTYIAPVVEDNGEVSGTFGVARRISRRKQLEIEVNRQKDFLKTMIDTIPDLVFYKDVNSTLLGANKACLERLLGLTEAEAIGKTITDIRTNKKKFVLKCLEDDRKVLATGKRLTSEEVMPLIDGSVIEVETIKAPFFDAAGKVAGLIGISRDITARKRLERQLKESQERYAAIVNNAPEIVMIYYRNTIQFINDAGVKALGYDREAIIGSKINQYLTPKSISRVAALLTGNRRKEAVNAHEIEFVNNAGEVRNGLVKGTRISYEGQQASLVVLLDVTERKRLYEKIKKRDEEILWELNLAARIQQETLPQPLCNSSVCASTIFLPYHTVSGDLVNYQWREPEKKLRGYIVDVSGHGVATAMQTATVKMLLDNKLLSGDTIDEAVFRQINQSMLQYLHEESFAGLMYFEFDFSSSTLKVITGGIHFFLQAKADNCALVPVFSGYLGMFDEVDVQTVTMPFKPGEVYCMMSDGASDLIELHGLNKQTGLNGYKAWLEKLAQSPERSDDFSVVCIEIPPKNKGVNISDIQSQEELEEAQASIAAFLEQNVPNYAVMLEVAVNEAINNGLRAGGRVNVTIKRLGNRITIRVKDGGPGYRPSTMSKRIKKDSDYDTEFDQLGMAEGGRGILMMEMLCDQLIYNAKGNEVLLMKKIIT